MQVYKFEKRIMLSLPHTDVVFVELALYFPDELQLLYAACFSEKMIQIPGGHHAPSSHIGCQARGN